MKLNEQRVITTTLYKGISFIVLSVLSGIVAGAFGFYRLSVSDHFTLTSLSTRVSALEQDHTTKSEVKLMVEGVNSQLKDISQRVQENNNLIIQHINQTAQFSK